MPLTNYDYLLKNYDFLSPEQQRLIDKFISLLPEREQYFAKRKYVDSATYEQIAEEMSYTVRTIYNIRERVLEKLKVYLISRENEILARTMRKIV